MSKSPSGCSVVRRSGNCGLLLRNSTPRCYHWKISQFRRTCRELELEFNDQKKLEKLRREHRSLTKKLGKTPTHAEFMRAATELKLLPKQLFIERFRDDVRSRWVAFQTCLSRLLTAMERAFGFTWRDRCGGNLRNPAHSCARKIKAGRRRSLSRFPRAENHRSAFLANDERRSLPCTTTGASVIGPGASWRARIYSSRGGSRTTGLSGLSYTRTGQKRHHMAAMNAIPINVSDESAPRDGKPPRRAFKISEVARTIGVSTATVRRAIQRGLFHPCRAFRHVLIPAEQVDAFLENRTSARWSSLPRKTKLPHPTAHHLRGRYLTTLTTPKRSRTGGWKNEKQFPDHEVCSW